VASILLRDLGSSRPIISANTGNLLPSSPARTTPEPETLRSIRRTVRSDSAGCLQLPMGPSLSTSIRRLSPPMPLSPSAIWAGTSYGRPESSQFDLALSRLFSVAERFKLEARCEAFTPSITPTSLRCRPPRIPAASAESPPRPIRESLQYRLEADVLNSTASNHYGRPGIPSSAAVVFGRRHSSAIANRSGQSAQAAESRSAAWSRSRRAAHGAISAPSEAVRDVGAVQAPRDCPAPRSAFPAVGQIPNPAWPPDAAPAYNPDPRQRLQRTDTAPHPGCPSGSATKVQGLGASRR